MLGLRSTVFLLTNLPVFALLLTFLVPIRHHPPFRELAGETQTPIYARCLKWYHRIWGKVERVYDSCPTPMK